ncbi:PPC domain-containing DNA-binding protein [Clostridium sp. DL1XJH146]
MDAKLIRIQSNETNSGRIISARLLPGVDIISGIKEICTKHSIKYGTIVSMVGSLSQLCLVYAIPSSTGKIGIKYTEPFIIEGPLELVSCQGTIGVDDKEEFDVHMHGIVSDKYMKIYGGHIMKEESLVLATVEVTIVELANANLVRKYDEETGFSVFNFL